MDVVDFIQSKFKISKEAEEILRSKVAEITFKKGEVFVEPINQSRYIYFVKTGIGRAFYLKEAKDITHEFFLENSFYMNIETILYQQPSFYQLEFIEESVVQKMSYDLFDELSSQYPELDRISRMFIIEVLLKLSNRIKSIQFQSAEERYDELIKQNPSLILRVPLGYVASYLGITQQTLSVIRSKIKK